MALCELMDTVESAMTVRHVSSVPCLHCAYSGLDYCMCKLQLSEPHQALVDLFGLMFAASATEELCKTRVGRLLVKALVWKYDRKRAYQTPTPMSTETPEE